MITQMKFGSGVVGIPYARCQGEHAERHEFVDLRTFPDAVNELPEPKLWPELKEFLVAVNLPAGCFSTLGCECADASGGNHPAGMTHKVTSYVQVAFADLALANSEDAYFVLVGRFFKSTDSRSKSEPIIVEFDFERFGFVDQNVGGQCLCIWVTGFGMDAKSTRTIWAEGLSVVREFLTDQSKNGAWRGSSPAA